jgi:hypothetical protein
MYIGEIKVKRRVWIGMALAAAVTVAWWSWTRTKLPPVLATTAKPAQPLVRLTGAGTVTGNQVLREMTELMDPAPLFLPTEWNYGQRELPAAVLKQPGQVFGGIPAIFTVDEQNLTPYGMEATAVPEKLVDVLVQGNEAPFAGLGQIGGLRPTLPVRLAFIEVWELKNGKVIISQQLSGILVPRSDFAPMEFLVMVGSAGLIGEPILTSGSGWDEVDNFFRIYLAKSYRLGERLHPGQYRVLVGA